MLLNASRRIGGRRCAHTAAARRRAHKTTQRVLAEPGGDVTPHTPPNVVAERPIIHAMPGFAR